MKITKLLIAIMTVSVLFVSCKQDNEGDEPEETLTAKRVTGVEIVGSSYTENHTYTYNANGLVSTHDIIKDNDEDQKTTFEFTYNADGIPTEWTKTASSGTESFTTTISDDEIIINGDNYPWVLELDENGKVEKYTHDIIEAYLSWSGEDLISLNKTLLFRYKYDYSHDAIRGITHIKIADIDHWTMSHNNLIDEVWLANNASDPGKLMISYNYVFDADGYPTSAVQTWWSSETTFTFTYEEYEIK